MLFPLSMVAIQTAEGGFDAFWSAAASPRALASYRLSFGAAAAAAAVNALFGLIVAWVLVRYTFPGKRFVDAIVDLPFSLPTAVAACLAALYSKTGWSAAHSSSASTAFTPIGTPSRSGHRAPFFVRTVQPCWKIWSAGRRGGAACVESPTTRRASASPLIPPFGGPCAGVRARRG